MLKFIFGKRATTKADVAIGVVAAILAAVKAVDTVNQYKTENKENEE